MYTVKSAYHLLSDASMQRRYHGQSRSGSSADIDNPTWKKLWKLKIPPKVRVFLWRVVNEFIPSRYKLYHRHVEKMGICMTCGNRAETMCHGLVECKPAILFCQ